MKCIYNRAVTFFFFQTKVKVRCSSNTFQGIKKINNDPTVKPFPLQNLPDPSDKDYSKTPRTIFFNFCVCVFETVRHF